VKSLRNGANVVFWVLEAARPGTLLGFRDGNGCNKDRERWQMGVYWFASERQNGNSG